MRNNITRVKLNSPMLSTRLNELLKERYDLDLLVEPIDHDHLQSVFEHYSEQRKMYRFEAIMESSAQYSKAYLISEAAHMILREIAPKRRKKKGTK